MSTPLYHSTPRACYVDQDLGICAPDFSSSAAIGAADRAAATTVLSVFAALRSIPAAQLDERVLALLANELRWLIEERTSWGRTEHGTDAGDRLCDVVILLENVSDAQIRSRA